MINQHVIDKVRTYIKDNNLDGMYITNKINLKYIITKDIADRIYITLEKVYIMVGSIYINEAKGLINSNDTSIINVSDLSSKEEILGLLKDKTIGIEAKDLTVFNERKLTNDYRVKKIVDTQNLIENIRMIKSNEEIEKIKKACEVTCKAFNYIIKYIKPGQTEKQICNELNRYMLDNGAQALAFDTIVASGENSSNPHAVVSDRIIQKNDIILLDFGAKYEDYCSDMSRTIFVGTPTDEMINRYNIVLNAQIQGVNSIKAGVKVGSIHDMIVQDFKQYNLENKFIHTTGHGVGMDIHEVPIIYSNNKELGFSEKMVVTVEPGIYFENEYGIRIEDTILVTKQRS